MLSLRGAWSCGTAKQKLRKTIYKGIIIVEREWAQHSVPLHFVCKRLEVLNHLALLSWSGGGPASEGQEAMKTQLVTQPAAATANETKRLRSVIMDKQDTKQREYAVIVECTKLPLKPNGVGSLWRFVL